MRHNSVAFRCCTAAWIGASVTGCAASSDQSTLAPAGPAAAEIAWLWWVMCGTFAVVFAVVMMVLLAAVIRRRPREPDANAAAPPLGRTGFVVAGGLIFPIVVVTPLYLLSLQTSAALRAPREGLTIQVVGHLWWWEVRYPDQGIVTANEIHIPAGQPVRLELTSADVIHSFWAPRLHGKRDLIPGIKNELWIEADQPGVYRGQCGEYCGTQHANMAFEIIALPPEEFAAWLARPQSNSRPVSDDGNRGAQVFQRAGCSQCHAVQGTPATGNVGPDLTHIGSRRTIAAATRANMRENLAAWIADPQAIKPGVKMPRTELTATDMQALLTYLEGLK